MERLTGIIRIMRKGEKRLLRHLYAANTNGEQKLRLKLFNLIEAGKVSTDAEAIMALGEKQSSSAFSHLKTRLREDILNVFLLQESSKRIPQPARAAGLECRKKLAQGYILMLRGAFKEGISVLNSVQLLANKYELPAELVLLNQLFREAVHAIKDIHHLEQVNNDIRVNLDKWNDIIRSEELALAMTMPHILRQGGALEAEIDNDLISELEQLYRNSNSARIGKWYYLAFIEHASTTGRYKDAIKAGLEFIALVENSPSIWSKNDVGGSNQMLGTAYLNTRAFSKAADHLTVADKNFPVAGNNRLMNLELLFRAQMGMGSLQDALITVETALSHPRIKVRPGTMPRWLYFQACAQFGIGDFNSAYRTLNREGYLTKQQDEWNTQFRVLEIMTMIEQGDEEWIDFKLSTLRKFLARYRRLGQPRAKASVEILSAILRKGLTHTELGRKAEEALTNCTEEIAGHSWNPEGAELIRIDQWVMRKRENQSG